MSQQTLHQLLWAGREVEALKRVDDGALSELSAPDRFGWTPLHRAASQGLLAAVEALIEAGVPVDEPAGPLGRTALMMAAQNDHARCVHALVEGGADWHAQDARGATAQDIAHMHGHGQTALALALLNRLPARAAATAGGCRP